MTVTFFNKSSGTLTFVSTFSKITCNHAVEYTPPFFNNSLLISSKPGDLWFFNLESALMISSISGGSSSDVVSGLSSS